MLKTNRTYLKILLIILLFLLTISTYSFAASVSRVTGLTVNQQSGKQAYLKWDSVSGASGYEIYVYLPSRGYTYIGSVRTNYVTLTGFAQEKTYYAKVRAYNDNDSNTYLDINSTNNKTYGDYSNEVTIFFPSNTNTTSVEKVTGLNYFTYDNGVSLNWNSLSNVSGYEIYVKVPQRGYFYIDSVTSNYTRLTGFPSNYTYSAKIRAYKIVNEEKVFGDFSNEVTFTINSYNNTNYHYDDYIPSQVSKISYKLYNSDLTLSWSSATNAAGYEVILYHPNGSYSTYTTTSTSKTIYGLPYGSYSAKVRAYNSNKQYGNYSSLIAFNIADYSKPLRVTGLTYTVNGSNVNLRWNHTGYASSYEIVLYYPNGSQSTYTTTDVTKTIYGLSYGYGYSVKVRAYNSNGYGSYSSSVTFNITKNNNNQYANVGVSGLTYSVNNGTIYLNWNKVTDAQGYEVELYFPGVGTMKYYTTETNRSISGLYVQKGYTIRVRPYFSGSKYGDYSNTIKFNVN